jgi:hypothetical protein
MSLGLIVSSLQAAEVTECVVRECLPDRVVIGRALPQCPGQMQAAGVLTAQQGIRAAEQPVRVCQPELVTGPAGGGQGRALGQGPVVQVPAPVEVRHECPGQLPRVLAQAAVHGLSDRGNQRRMLGLEPRERLRVVGRRFRAHSLRGGRQVNRPAPRIKVLASRVGGVQVVIQNPLNRRMADCLAVNGVGEFGRVGTQQVVAGVPAEPVLGEQAGSRQFAESGPGPPPGNPGHARGGRQRYVRTDMNAEQAEHRRGRRAQTAVGPGQHDAHAGGLVAGLERV